MNSTINDKHTATDLALYSFFKIKIRVNTTSMMNNRDLFRSYSPFEYLKLSKICHLVSKSIRIK